MHIIPAIDIIDGKCVRLTQGDYSKMKTYSNHPEDIAVSFEENGIKKLHLVDLEGAKSGTMKNIDVLRKICNRTSLEVDYSGGLRSEDDISQAFESGAHEVSVGSIAVKEPQTFYDWIAKYGAHKIILGADVNNGNIAISGWQDKTSIQLFDFLKENTSKGIQKIICTDISKDGLLEGASHDLYRSIQEVYPSLNIIASGGVSSMTDIIKLKESGLYGVIIGKAFYEGKISLEDLGNAQC